MQVLVVLGPDTGADADLLGDQARSAAEELGVDLRLVTAAAADRVMAVLSGHDGPAVAVTSDPVVISSVAAEVVCYDLRIADVVRGPLHLHGRGVWGLPWAVRHAVHRKRSPAQRVRYGDGQDQWADERQPESSWGAGDPGPVAVLVHGGFWRSVWGADLMDALAIDLARHGWLAWNLEYRRPDRHGWVATTADVADGIRAAEQRWPGRPVVLFGHSAGGQLVLQAAADNPGIALAVSLAGVVDLPEGYRRGLGDGAIGMALGGSPEEKPEVYRTADPFSRLPLRTAALLVQGTQDSPDLVDFNRRFARASGAPLIERPGDHFDVITPGSQIWWDTMDEVERWLDRPVSTSVE